MLFIIYCSGGSCPFTNNINSNNRMYSEMPSNARQLDEMMCGPYSGRGFLCGECEDGYGPPIFFTTANCSQVLG